MGNLTTSFGGRFVILGSSQEACLRAVWPDAPKGGFLARLRPRPGPRLAEAFARQGWALVFDAQGDVTSVRFTGEKLSGLQVFEAAAPFVEPGSHVDFWQEYAGGEGDRPNTRWTFDGGKMTWHDLTPPEVRAAERLAEQRWRDRDQAAEAATNAENLQRLQRGEAPLCSNCAAVRAPESRMTPKDWPAPTVDPVVVMKAHECPACAAVFLPLSEQERFNATIKARNAARQQS